MQPDIDWTRILSYPGIIVILALSIPILAILLAGLKGIVRAMRGEPDDFAAWQEEVMHLRARVESLERSVRGEQPVGRR